MIAVGRLHLGQEVMTYNGFGVGGTKMYVPMLFKNAYSGNYNAALNIQNTDLLGSAAVNVKYYDSTGSPTCEDNFTIARLGIRSLWLPDVTCLPDGWVGGAVITADRPVAAVGRPHIGSQVTTYAGFSSGSRSMYLPMLFKNAFDGTYNVAFYVQNTAAYQTADITIRYYDSNGNLTCTVQDTLAALASKGYWLPSVGCLPDGWVGGAVVSANTNIVVLGRPHVGAEVMTYSGISGSSSFYLPMLYRNFSGSGGTYNSAIYLQNTDTVNESSVDFLFLDESGSLHCAKMVKLPAGATVGYWLPSLICTP